MILYPGNERFRSPLRAFGRGLHRAIDTTAAAAAASAAARKKKKKKRKSLSQVYLKSCRKYSR